MAHGIGGPGGRFGRVTGFIVWNVRLKAPRRVLLNTPPARADVGEDLLLRVIRLGGAGRFLNQVGQPGNIARRRIPMDSPSRGGAGQGADGLPEHVIPPCRISRRVSNVLDQRFKARADGPVSLLTRFGLPISFEGRCMSRHGAAPSFPCVEPRVGVEIKVCNTMLVRSQDKTPLGPSHI